MLYQTSTFTMSRLFTTVGSTSRKRAKVYRSSLSEQCSKCSVHHPNMNLLTILIVSHNALRNLSLYQL